MVTENTDPATAAIRDYMNSLYDKNGERTDLMGSALLTVTLFSGGGGSFGSDGTCLATCGTVAYDLKGVAFADLTEAERVTIRAAQEVLKEALLRRGSE